MSLWGLIQHAFHEYASRPALTHSDGSVIRYGELELLVDGMAKKMQPYVAHGSRVAILEENPVQEAICILACLSLNVTVVPLAVKYGEARIVQIIQQTQPQFVIASAEAGFGERLKAACEAAGTTILTTEAGSLGDAPPRRRTELSKEPAMPVSFIMYTSGSTGQPKGTVLTYNNIKANLEDIQRYFAVAPEDHILINRSLSHASVLTGEFLLGCAQGAQITFYNEPFVPRRLLSFMEQRRITVFCSTPTILYQLAMDKVERHVPDLRKVALMGEHLHKQVALKVKARFPHVSFYMLYGQTEASPRITYLLPEFFGVKDGCIGVPLDSMQADVVDESGRSLGGGEKGELIVQGPNVFWGYWNNPELTARKLQGGWLYTGDIVRRGEDGLLYMVGRQDDLVIRAGMNIYPKEIEDILLEDARIRQAVVYGEPDPRYGQKLHASVVGEPGAELTTADVMDICKRQLATYQYPDVVRIVDEIPRNAAGKVVRRHIV